MNKYFILVLTLIISGFVFLATPSTASAGYTRGYYKSSGTYVQPYYRSNPNALRYDNYTYRSGRYNTSTIYNRSYYVPTRNYSYRWYTPSYYTQSNYYTGYSSYLRGY